ncbi:hypothetical protein PQQ96_25375 [Paraburkholderia sediminicola]|uniref:hypothetical protein n=1 Tax=Paraburkholderia sediminicola TaxID=458836 RepID=UPI0038BCF3D2
MIESWTGVIIGLFALVIAATLVVGHYRREHLRERLLRPMEHPSPVGRDAASALTPLFVSRPFVSGSHVELRFPQAR